MEKFSKEKERRADQRRKQTVQIRLNDHQVRSKNICSGGAYFEVINEDIKPFSLGKTFALEITISSTESGFPNKTVRLSGFGIIIRTDRYSDEKEVNEYEKTFGVAVKFKKKLKVESVTF
ncbi:MAG: hypothetical protein D8M57_01620 [Candidatus Scalindua sp. AMX11]|nr:MAG: hypothetical protein DWQ00_15605 [Candidatus Scalindua sp.]NOG85087.1 hypothetical protein [Planctomycetota bacterium]RZV69329.1 MAG: hypothetical protein EX341_16205 [Candidatus Scalindua sp. SCAELEC01]TDE66761.1 MAG: hypothetical protein D8M57_01620 [Candidatus Scalindua sp. AMX11]GJQ58072.1 MAG: hypothetical protein SCALA701_08730 [Candidatus Scalindua sp.]